jgi:predicted phosphodiesterase
MRIAVISDIHSNVFALEAVLRDIDNVEVDETWLVGDTFGYYPWASRTFAAVQRASPLSVLGNHDQWVIGAHGVPDGIAGMIARHNTEQLASESPAALDWLAALPICREFKRAGWTVRMTHGTPDDPLEGRYYPDDDAAYSWLPRSGEVLVLGQTHYPLVRAEPQGGILINPGSVGQSRDGNPMPSWVLLDLGAARAELRRTVYDNQHVIERLRTLGWDDRITCALDRRRP